MSKFTTPYKYAKLCGVTSQAIYDRIKNGTLKTVDKKDVCGTVKRYIDLEKFPPGRKD